MVKARDWTAAESMTTAMGTMMTHRVFGAQASAAISAAEAETVRLEKLLSRFHPDSDISRINSMSGKGTINVSGETFEVLAQAFAYSKSSRGAFDVTIGPLVRLWDILNTSEPPVESEIKKVLQLVDYTGLVLNDDLKKAGLKKRGQSIDLGGIGKGCAADKILSVFKAHGITSAYTNLGGNLAVLGTKPDGSPWRVGIFHPRRKGDIIGAVAVGDKSVVTSGDYQRCFTAEDGKRYHHILDPETGYPAEKGLISATVIAESSVAADALSTALFTLGLEKGLKLMKAYPGTEAVLIDTNLTVYVTSGIVKSFRTEEDVQITTIYI